MPPLAIGELIVVVPLPLIVRVLLLLLLDKFSIEKHRVDGDTGAEIQRRVAVSSIAKSRSIASSRRTAGGPVSTCGPRAVRRSVPSGAARQNRLIFEAINKRQQKRGRKTARLSTHLTVTKTKHLWGWMGIAERYRNQSLSRESI